MKATGLAQFRAGHRVRGISPPEHVAKRYRSAPHPVPPGPEQDTPGPQAASLGRRPTGTRADAQPAGRRPPLTLAGAQFATPSPPRCVHQDVGNSWGSPAAGAAHPASDQGPSPHFPSSPRFMEVQEHEASQVITAQGPAPPGHLPGRGSSALPTGLMLVSAICLAPNYNC